MLGRDIRTTALIAIALLAISTGPARAQHVYKSVDADGNVTYSEIPPGEGSAREVQEIDLLPGPSPEDQQAAHQRLRSHSAASQALSQQRKADDKARAAAVSAAQQELIRARAQLEQAKIPGDGDWQHLAKGGRVLKPSYYERLTAAQDKVAAAEKALDAARQGR